MAATVTVIDPNSLNSNVALTFGDSLTLTDTRRNPDGTPVDLTGYAISVDIRSYFSDPRNSPLMTVAGSAPTPTNGTWIVTLDNATTRAFPPGKYNYRVYGKNGAVSDTLAWGLLIIHQ